MGAEVYLPGQASSAAKVVHSLEWPKHEVDEELRSLMSETIAWLPAVRGAVETFVDENHSANREHSLLAIQVAMDYFNEALGRLTLAVRSRSIV